MYRILYYIIISVITLFSLLPLKVHYLFSDLICFILSRILGYRADTIYTNLARSFPDKKYKELKKMARDYYHFMSDLVVEAIWAYTASTRRIGRHIRFSNEDLLNEVYGEGRNIMVVMGHFGSWEIYTGMPHLKETYGLNIANEDYMYVYKKMHSKVSDAVIHRLRSRHRACTLVESHNILRYMLKHRDGKGVYYFIADQSPAFGSGHVTGFLHQPTRFMGGAEFVARKMKMPVFYFSSNREKRGYYRGDYHLICEDASLCEEGYVTRELARLLEQSIQENPSTWLWSHRRWKEKIIKP